MGFTSTDARTIVFYLFEKLNKTPTNKDIPRQIINAKKLLEKYTVDEIKETIDTVIEQGKDIYSLALIPYVIEPIVAISRRKLAEQKIETMQAPKVTETTMNSNNVNKASTFGIKKDWGGWGEL